MAALASQNVGVTGTVYRLASPTVNTGAVTLAARVGGSASGTVTNLTAGGTAASSLGISLNTSTSGTFGGSQTVNFTSTGAGTDGAADLAIAGGMVGLTGKVYQAAAASVAPTVISFGTVHVGSTASQVVAIGNTASGALTDVLTGGFGAVSTGFTGSGTLGSGVAAGSSSNALSVSLNTGSAGVYGGTAALALASHDGDLADQAVAAGPITLSGTVNNYAISGLGQSGGAGSFTGRSNAYTLDFGTVAQGFILMSTLFAEHYAIGPADLLAGLFTTVTGSGFDTSGLTSFNGLMAQQRFAGLSVSFSATTLGSFMETIDLRGTGSNGSGYSGSVVDTLLTIEGSVVLAGGSGTSVPEPGTLAVLVSALAGLFVSRRGHG